MTYFTLSQFEKINSNSYSYKAEINFHRKYEYKSGYKLNLVLLYTNKKYILLDITLSITKVNSKYSYDVKISFNNYNINEVLSGKQLEEIKYKEGKNFIEIFSTDSNKPIHLHCDNGTIGIIHQNIYESIPTVPSLSRKQNTQQSLSSIVPRPIKKTHHCDLFHRLTSN